MKLNTKTRDILKNFSSFNTQLLITPGNVIRAKCNSGDDLLAYATVDEPFTETCGIHDLSKLISVLSLFTEPDVDFTSKYISVYTDRQRVNLACASPDMIKEPLDYDVELEGSVNFDLNVLDYTKIWKATAALNHTEVLFRGREGTLSIEGTNIKDPTSDSFALDVGKTDRTFAVIIPRDRLVFMNRDYKVTIADEPGIKFASDDVTYYVTYLADGNSDSGDL